MSRSTLIQEKADAFDRVGTIKHEAAQTLANLKELRRKYAFTENLREIEWLDPDKLFKVNPDEVGEFFRLIDACFKAIPAPITAGSNVYRNARLQIKELKNLLRTAVDDRKSLGEKIDATWERIGGMGQDKTLAKKIIFCFNYEKGTMLPILSNQHLRHFVNRTSDTSGQTKYYSMGQEYEHYTTELFETKNSQPVTKNWDPNYFTRFLYATYPPPDSEPQPALGERRVGTVTDEQLDMQGFMKLLGELQKQGKINGEQFRDYRAIWMQQSSEREGLAQRLKRLLGT